MAVHRARLMTANLPETLPLSSHSSGLRHQTNGRPNSPTDQRHLGHIDSHCQFAPLSHLSRRTRPAGGSVPAGGERALHDYFHRGRFLYSIDWHVYHLLEDLSSSEVSHSPQGIQYQQPFDAHSTRPFSSRCALVTLLASQSWRQAILVAQPFEVPEANAPYQSLLERHRGR